MTALVVIGHTESSWTIEVLLALLRMQAPDTEGSVGFCLVKGMTATSKVGFVAVAQLSVAVAMVVIVVGVNTLAPVIRALCRRWCPLVSGSAATSIDDPGAALLSESGRVGGYGTTSSASVGRITSHMEIAPVDTGNGVTRDGDHAPVVGRVHSRRARLTTAAVNYFLTACSTLTVAVVKMLHCVWVPGTPQGQRHLFIRATQLCAYGAWQLPYLLLLILLIAIVLVLPWVAAWSLRSPTASTAIAHSSSWTLLTADVRAGVRWALVESYKPTAYWWEAALLGQRLVS